MPAEVCSRHPLSVFRFVNLQLINLMLLAYIATICGQFGELTKMNMRTTAFKPEAETDVAIPASAPLDSSLLSIGDMARTFGVSLRTLRFYEGRGLLDPKRDGSSRYYGAEDRRRLKLILKGKQLGFTLAEIREFIAKDRHGNGHALALNDEQISLQINHLERQRRALDEAIQELRARL